MTNSMVRSPCTPAHVWDYLCTVWLQGTVRTHRATAWDPSVWLWSPKTVYKVPNCPPPRKTKEFSVLHMLAKTGVTRHCFLLIQWVINGIFLLFDFSWLLLRCLLIYVGFPLCGWPIHILWPFRKIAVFFLKKELIYFQLLLIFFSYCGNYLQIDETLLWSVTKIRAKGFAITFEAMHTKTTAKFLRLDKRNLKGKRSSGNRLMYWSTPSWKQLVMV